MSVHVILAIVMLLSHLMPWSVPAQAPASEDLTLWPLNGPSIPVIRVAQDPSRPERLWAIVATHTSRRVTALYRSEDRGLTWQPAGNDLGWLELTSLAVDDQGNLWVGTTAGLYRRRADAREFQRIPLDAELEPRRDGSSSLWQGLNVVDILAPTQTGGALFVVAVEQGKYPRSFLFRSDDGGQTFVRALVREYDVGPGGGLGRLWRDPEDPNRLYASTRGGVLVSDDGGQRWIPGGLDPSLALGFTILLPRRSADGGLLAFRAIQDDRGVHVAMARSEDGGRSWAESTIEGMAGVIPVDGGSLPDGRLLLATSQGLYEGTSDGQRWTRSGPASGELGVYQVLVDGPSTGRAYLATPLGLYRWPDGALLKGTGRRSLPPNGRVARVYTWPGRPQMLLGATARLFVDRDVAFPSIVFSEDGGARWQPAVGAPQVAVTGFAADPRRPDRVYAATSRGLCRSDTAGRSWAGCWLEDTRVEGVVVGMDGAIYIATGGRGVLMSSDGGETWAVLGLDGLNAAGMLWRSDGLYVIVRGRQAGLYRTSDGGRTWSLLPAPKEGMEIVRLVGDDSVLLAALADGSLWISVAGGLTWEEASALPKGSSIQALWVDPRTRGRWLVAFDGGGLWMTSDGGQTWRLTSATLGDNVVLSLAADFRTSEDVIASTKMAGVWATFAEATPSPEPSAVDARIEILWPHGWASVDQATRANLTARVFYPDSLEPVPCRYDRSVEVWEAKDSQPAARIGVARPRTGAAGWTALWDLNDVDVSYAQRPEAKLYYLLRVPGVATRSTVWAHAADARTYYPLPAWPDSVAAELPVRQIDARILIVWPHDRQGRQASVQQAELANIRVALYHPGTLQSVPGRPELKVRLYGALDNGVGRLLGQGQLRVVADRGIPVWDFDNIDVSAARDGRSRWAFWVEVEGYETRSNVWIHGVDARTFLPQADEPIVGCRP